MRDFLASRGITLPEGTPDDPPDAQTVHGLGNRKNELLLDAHQEDGRASRTRARVRYLQAAPRRPGCAAPSSRSSANTARCSRRPGSTDLLEVRVDGVTIARARPARQARAGHVPGRRPASSASRRPQAAVFEDALAGVAAGQAGGFGFVVGVDRVGATRRRRCASTAPTSWSTTWPSCCERSLSRTFPVEPWAVRETRLDLDAARPDRVAVRAVQRAHRAARQPRRGRAARAARHLPQLVLRAAPAALRRGRLRLPGVGPDVVNVTNGKLIRLLVDDEPFDVRYGDLRQPRARPRPAGRACCSRDVEWALAGRAARSGSARTRLVSFDQRSIAAIATRSSRSTAPARMIVQSELVANEDLPGAERATRGSPRCWSTPLEAGGARRPRARAPCCVHRTQAQPPAARRRRWTTRSRRRAGRASHTEATDRTGPGPPSPASCSPASGCGWSSSSRTAGRASAPGRRCATRSHGALAGARLAGWDGLLAAQRRVPRRVLGRTPTSRSRATPRCSRRCGSRCSTCCRPARGPSGGRSRPRA